MNNTVNAILIIGAGQIGSRHLQGLLKVSSPLNILVVDPSKESLQTAEDRANEISHKHIIKFQGDLENIPSSIDLAIIATSANIREIVIKQLLELTSLKYLILEKVLFQRPSSYDEIPAILDAAGVITWVNLPMRTYKHFEEIKRTLGKENESISVSVVGGNWRIGCNAIHYLDLFEYLTNSRIQHFKTDGLDNEIFESKRAGFVEFLGSVSALSSNGSALTLHSFPGDFSDLTVYISSSNHRFIVHDGQQSQIIHLSSENNFIASAKPYQPEYQSNLTGDYVNSILTTGNCHLSKLNDIVHTHKLYIEQLLHFYNRASGSDAQICPIT